MMPLLGHGGARVPGARPSFATAVRCAQVAIDVLPLVLFRVEATHNHPGGNACRKVRRCERGTHLRVSKAPGRRSALARERAVPPGAVDAAGRPPLIARSGLRLERGDPLLHITRASRIARDNQDKERPPHPPILAELTP